ncbi:DUF2500 domain-containing protein [Paenibacillus sp. FSL K6-0276]|uniref:DUF2500 domain-containing protein n=1 Tax=Paenibacillus sp. FSL K6-0276 TaxID=2921450 RepID=UPI0030EE0650
MSEWRDFNGFVQRSPYDNFIHEMPLLFKIFTFIIVTFAALMIIRSVRNWIRSEVSGGSGDSSTKPSYFVTFEIDGGNRLELHVMDQEYGLITEGDRGELSYQGSRFKGFDRILKTE